jgi:hypothetical protein
LGRGRPPVVTQSAGRCAAGAPGGDGLRAKGCFPRGVARITRRPARSDRRAEETAAMAASAARIMWTRSWSDLTVSTKGVTHRSRTRSAIAGLFDT